MNIYMKNIFQIILSSALLLLTLNSCSDFLDKPVQGQENLDTYFQNTEECEKQITGCYQSIFWDDWWQIANFQLLADMCTDDMWMGNTTQTNSDYYDVVFYTGNGHTNATSNYWQYRYKGILRTNVSIERIPDANISDANLKARFIGEAKFIRAFHYFELVKNFGGVPIVDKMTMPNEVEGIVRQSVDSCYNFIINDLKDAIKVLPRRSEYSSSDIGRATKGAAQGYLAKVYLYQKKYELAEEVLNDMIKREGIDFDLLPDFGQVWDIDHNNSIESLFEVQYSDDPNYNIGGRISVVCGSRDDSGWSWGLPTSNLEKAFLDAGDTERLKWTIIKDGATEIPGEPAVDSENPYVISASKHKSGRVSRKLYEPQAKRPTNYDANHNPLNYRLLRYADILLMHAEVENALGKDAEALISINKVRSRVHLEPLTSTDTELRDDIRNERRLELALEGNRLYDLRRWDDDSGHKMIANVMGPNGTFVKYNTEESTDEYELSNQKEASDEGSQFDENRDLLFPIPNSEVTMSNGTIVQNKNYQ